LKAVADVERAIIKALEKQYSEILAPLKDSIPKKLGMRVQKLARRQSATLYIVPNQVRSCESFYNMYLIVFFINNLRNCITMEYLK